MSADVTPELPEETSFEETSLEQEENSENALKEEITPAALDKKGEKFRPYRSVVAWYCWRALG